MEQGPKVRDQEPEGGKAAVNPAKAAKGPTQIPAPDQGKDKAEDKAEDKVEAVAPEKAGMEAVFEKNTIKNV